MIFTGIGWLASPSGSSPGSEADPGAYVAPFFDLTPDPDLEYATWIFLHDRDGPATVRPADAPWRIEVALRE